MESTASATKYVVCLDFGRPILFVVFVSAFFASLVKGISGMGEAIVFTSIWQLAYIIFDVAETENMGLLSALICVQQCMTTAQLALINFKLFRLYWRPGVILGTTMVMLSPLGNHVRESAPTETISLALGFLFLAFALLKIVADGVKQFSEKKKAQTLFRSNPQAVGAVEGGFEIEERGVDLQIEADSEIDNTLHTSVPTEDNDKDIDANIDNIEALRASAGVESAEAKDSLSPTEGISEDMSGLDQEFQQQTTPEPLTPASRVTGRSFGEFARKNSVVEVAAHDMPSPPGWLFKVLPFVGACGGFLGGLCGMNGPPFILLVAFTGLDKRLSRPLFPMGQLPEVWLYRLPALISLGHLKVEDAHLFAASLFVTQAGLLLGNRLSKMISQVNFERGILFFLIVSSMSVLGIIQGHPRAVICLMGSALVLFARVACSWWLSADIKST